MALSAATTLQLRNTQCARIGRMQIKTSSKVWKHAMLCCATAGKAFPATTAAGQHFLGIAQESYTTSLATALQTAVYLYGMDARIPNRTATSGAAYLQHVVYANTDEKCIFGVGAATQGAACGVVREVDGASYTWVELGAYPLTVSA